MPPVPRVKNNLWPIVLAFPVAMLGAVTARYALLLPDVYDQVLARFPMLRGPLLAAGMEGSVEWLAAAYGVGAAFLLCGSIVALLLRRAWTLALLHASYFCGYAILALFARIVLRITSVIMVDNVAITGVPPNPILVFEWRWHVLWPAALAAALLAALHLFSWRRKVIELYTGRPFDGLAPGDRILENLRSQGSDPPFRKGMLFSVTSHLMVILVIPWLLSLRGCVSDYRIQKGSGTPQVAAAPAVKMVKAPKKKKRKRYILNTQSAISFHVPDLDESMLGKEVEEMTQATYRADPNRVLSGTGRGAGGKLGAGGGKTGGWPDGVDKGLVRFIRLEYKGEGWDDGMDAVSRADINFLEMFYKTTGLKTAPRSESHPIASLARYRKGFAPPFVYMTGSGDINVSGSDAKILREYLQDGGLLFADCGSPKWNQSFHNLMRQVFPGEPMRAIADDDPIFLMPYVFPNGAPPLWHHGGNRAMGVKYQGRWVVFYHPGDVNDTWKTGHSGMDPALAQAAKELGINVVYYAFTHYLEMTRKYRK